MKLRRVNQTAVAFGSPESVKRAIRVPTQLSLGVHVCSYYLDATKQRSNSEINLVPLAYFAVPA